MSDYAWLQLEDDQGELYNIKINPEHPLSHFALVRTDETAHPFVIAFCERKQEWHAYDHFIGIEMATVTYTFLRQFVLPHKVCDLVFKQDDMFYFCLENGWLVFGPA